MREMILQYMLKTVTSMRYKTANIIALSIQLNLDPPIWSHISFGISPPPTLVTKGVNCLLQFKTTQSPTFYYQEGNKVWVISLWLVDNDAAQRRTAKKGLVGAQGGKADYLGRWEEREEERDPQKRKRKRGATLGQNKAYLRKGCNGVSDWPDCLWH